MAAKDTNTKFNLGPYGSIETDDVKAFLNLKGNELLGYSQQRFDELKKYAEEGNWTWKVAGLLAGLLIIGNSFLSFFSHLASLSPFSAVIDVYLIVFGIIACLLEYKEKTLTKAQLDTLKREALFLYRPYGRAAFYFFIGLLIIATGGLLGFIIGIFVCVIGVIIFHASRQAFNQLNTLKGSLHNEQEVAAKFKEFDKDGSGFLDSVELAALCRSLGTQLTLNELESALFILDKNEDGKISFTEFFEWWKGKDENII